MIRHTLKLALLAPLVVAGCSGVQSSNKVDVGVVVGPGGGTTSETGTSATYVVTLRTQPKADVVIPLSSTDTSEAVLSSSGQLVFSRDDWNVAHTITVTGVDDEIADGHAAYEIVFGATQSADPSYNGLQIAAIPATNLDDEEVGVVVSTVSGPTTEGGLEATFTVRLTAKPEGVVSIPFASSDTTEGTATGQSVEFTTANWNVARTITIEGVDDGTPDGNQIFAITLGPIVSVDPNWDGFELSPVLLVNVDDDLPGITVGPASSATTEVGGSATFTVQLNSQPASSVILSLDSDDATEGSVDATTLTFTTANWATPQTVTVTGEDDDAADGPVTYHVDFGASVSLDAAYSGLVPDGVLLINADDENAAMTVFPTNGLTSESGDAVVFEVVLAAQPSNDVVVEASVTNRKEASVAPSTFTFTAANWNDPVQVTVTGKNDFLEDGHKTYSLVLRATGDATYAALAPTTAILTNVDNGPPATVVVYNDNLGTFADEAATELGFGVTNVATQADLVTALGADPTIVVWEASSGAALDPTVVPALDTWLSNGGRLVHSDTDLDGQPAMQSLLEVSSVAPFDGFRSVQARTMLRGDLFKLANTLPSPLNGVNVVANDNGSELMLVSTSGVLAATYVGTTSGAMAVTRDFHVIVNGFAPDDAVGTNGDGDGKVDMQELYENELRYLISLPLRTLRKDFSTVTPLPTTVTAVNLPITFPEDEVIQKVSLSFYITHTNDDDIDALLVPPSGSTIEVVTDIGVSGDNFGTACAPDAARAIFDATAPTVPPDASASAPFVGTVWRPEGDLTVLQGTSTLGTWNLRVTDDVSGTTNIGTVHCWSLMLTVEDSE